MSSRRSVFKDLMPETHTHAGLWLDRFLKAQTSARESGDDKDPAAGEKAALIQQVSKLQVAQGYFQSIAHRRRDAERLKEDGKGLYTEATVAGRLIIGLGAKGPIEAGLHLDHTWGVPVLPGSALKGLCAATAHQLLEDLSWRKGGEAGEPGSRYAFLFGMQEHIGHVHFHDAWWIPGTADEVLPIHLDVMTVHHGDYYQGKPSQGDIVPPAETDSPVPVSFASVNGRFLIVVEGPPDWCDAALTILGHGLRELGLGAKTNAGYGRMDLTFESRDDAANRVLQEATREAERVLKQQEQDAAAVSGIIKGLNAGNAEVQVTQWLARLKGPARQNFAQLAIGKLTERWFREKDRNQKPWVQSLRTAAEGSD